MFGVVHVFCETSLVSQLVDDDFFSKFLRQVVNIYNSIIHSSQTSLEYVLNASFDFPIEVSLEIFCTLTKTPIFQLVEPSIKILNEKIFHVFHNQIENSQFFSKKVLGEIAYYLGRKSLDKFSTFSFHPAQYTPPIAPRYPISPELIRSQLVAKFHYTPSTNLKQAKARVSKMTPFALTQKLEKIREITLEKYCESQRAIDFAYCVLQKSNTFSHLIDLPTDYHSPWKVNINLDHIPTEYLTQPNLRNFKIWLQNSQPTSLSKYLTHSDPEDKLLDFAEQIFDSVPPILLEFIQPSPKIAQWVEYFYWIETCLLPKLSKLILSQTDTADVHLNDTYNETVKLKKRQLVSLDSLVENHSVGIDKAISQTPSVNSLLYIISHGFNKNPNGFDILLYCIEEKLDSYVRAIIKNNPQLLLKPYYVYFLPILKSLHIPLVKVWLQFDPDCLLRYETHIYDFFSNQNGLNSKDFDHFEEELYNLRS